MRWAHFRIMANDDTVAVCDRDTAYAHAKRHQAWDCPVSWPICEEEGWEPEALVNDVAIVRLGAGLYACVAPVVHHGIVRDPEMPTNLVGCPRCKEIEVALVNGVMLSHDGYPCTNQEERA